jgi:hypothetical protein
MGVIDIKRLVLQEVKNSGIYEKDIASLESIITIAEATMAPKMLFKFKMLDGTERQVTSNFTTEQILDLNAHGINVIGDIEDLKKYFARKISLRTLLGEDE